MIGIPLARGRFSFHKGVAARAAVACACVWGLPARLGKRVKNFRISLHVFSTCKKALHVRNPLRQGTGRLCRLRAAVHAGRSSN